MATNYKVPLGIHAVPQCEPLIDVNAAARILALHVNTVRKWAKAGLIPSMRIGACWRFRASSLDAWMKSQLELPQKKASGQ